MEEGNVKAMREALEALVGVIDKYDSKAFASKVFARREVGEWGEEVD